MKKLFLAVVLTLGSLSVQASPAQILDDAIALVANLMRSQKPTINPYLKNYGGKNIAPSANYEPVYWGARVSTVSSNSVRVNVVHLTTSSKGQVGPSIQYSISTTSGATVDDAARITAIERDVRSIAANYGDEVKVSVINGNQASSRALVIDINGSMGKESLEELLHSLTIKALQAEG